MYKLTENKTQIIHKEYVKSEFSKSTIRNKFIDTKVNSNNIKNYSSIKGLIKRLESVGNTKINYPKLKIKNQKPDIFMHGGSINYIKKTGFQNQYQLLGRKTVLKHRKSQTKMTNFGSNQQLDEEQSPLVYIHKNNRSILTDDTQLIKISSSIQTQISSSVKIQYSPGTIKNIQFEAPLDRYNKIEKTFNTQTCLQNHSSVNNVKKIKQNSQVGRDKKIYPRVDPLLTQYHCQQGSKKAQQKVASTSVIKRIKTYKSVSNPTPSLKKPMQGCDLCKPVFYLSQCQLKQLWVTSKNFIVTEYPSGRIITGSYFKQVTQIASLTKIVTFYCCLKLIDKLAINLDQEFLNVDQQVEATTGTSAELQEGDQYTLRQICYAMMLPSGNDAALALAKWAGKKLTTDSPNQSYIKVFMTFMNNTCNQIGMKSSYFGNPHGLPHHKSGTTVQDVAIVINKALSYPFFREVVRTKTYKCNVQNSGLIRQVKWQNTNKLLRRKGFIGIKTGVTVTAGPCLATCYETGSKIYTIVLLKTSKPSRRFKQTRRILAMVLSKLNYNEHQLEIKEIIRNDAEFDSDNSQDEQQFNYQRNDAQQMKKRLKIITYQM